MKHLERCRIHPRGQYRSTSWVACEVSLTRHLRVERLRRSRNTVTDKPGHGLCPGVALLPNLVELATEPLILSAGQAFFVRQRACHWSRRATGSTPVESERL